MQCMAERLGVEMVAPQSELDAITARDLLINQASVEKRAGNIEQYKACMKQAVKINKKMRREKKGM